MIVTLDSKRRLIVPAALALVSPGERFDARFDAEEDAIILRRLAGKEGWLTILKECPVSMDDVPPRRREMARHRKLPTVTSLKPTVSQDGRKRSKSR